MAKRIGGKGPHDRINHLQVVVDADERAEIKLRGGVRTVGVGRPAAVALGREVSPVLDHKAVGELVEARREAGVSG